MAAETDVPWTGVLTTELSRRLAVLVAEMRTESTADPVLKGVVITDEEVDGVLSSVAGGGTAGTAGVAALAHEPGSLTAMIAERSPRSAAHLLMLQRRFGLDGFEMDCLLVCLASEIHPRFERVFAYLNDNVTLKQPGADTLIRAVAPGQLSLQVHLARTGRLLRYGLLEAPEGARFGPYRVADGIVRFALAHGGLDAALARVWSDDDMPPLGAELWDTRPEVDELERLVREGLASRAPLIVTVRGRSGSGRRYLAQQACRRLGLGCLTLDARQIKRGESAERTLTAAMRDSALLGAPVVLHRADTWLDDAQQLAEIQTTLKPLVRELGWILVLTCDGEMDVAPWFPAARVVDVELPPLSAGDREAAWTLALRDVPGLSASGRRPLVTALAAKFRLTHGEIALALHRATSAAVTALDDTAWSDLLHRSASIVAAPRLQQLAQRLVVGHTLDDLVLPADRADALKEVVRRVKHRRTVLEQWVFDAVSSRGRGLIVLFFGPSGTGKTMGAEAIADALKMNVYRIDLAGVVSKYIGETEKNLRAIFEEADRADAVLFFDEADALFGRRSEVRDSHDRYANIEINYLLQRIESFEGIAILATNMRGHIDDAFLRRIHVTVEFPLPRADERLRLWDRSFPERAPVTGDVDWEFLARRFELTGGTIRNAALGAAFLAADTTGSIGMPEIVNALRAELIKAGRRVTDSEFGPYAKHLHTAPPAARPMRRARAAYPAALPA
ncbi:MAG: ATP-binding protein [Gemmatimonadaceae bacterium]